jgi:prepilin-type N-terminal cleavage/methylation domain-containing protein
MNDAQKKRLRPWASKFSSYARGFTMLEITIVLAVTGITAAMAIPHIQSGMNSYRLHGAMANATWAIQSTRYQALMQGYPYQVVFSATNKTYQIQDLPSGTTYLNVGNAVPLSGSKISLNADTTLTFKPNGFVNDPNNLYYFTITYNGLCQKATVSNYANITLSTPASSCS